MASVYKFAETEDFLRSYDFKADNLQKTLSHKLVEFNARGSWHGLFLTHHNRKTGLFHYGCSVWNRIDRGV